jgi:LysM repeat protein
MASYLLKLGTAGFTIDDLPEELSLGGEHAIAVRKFPGGKIHIQALGAFESEITWQSDFLGGDALTRAQAIDKMRIDGNEVLLQFGSIVKYVIITKFTYKFRNNSQVGYEITVQPAGTSLQAVSVGSDVSRFISQIPISAYSPSSTSYPTAPPASPLSTPSTPPAPSPPPQRTHTIVSGDTLWGLAVKYYGNGTLWTKISAANGNPNPRTLRIGSTLVIP